MKPLTGLSSVNSTIGGYWLGGYRSAETNNFKWVDNSPFSFTSWGPGQPDNEGQMENFIHDLYIINQLKYTGWNDEDWYVHYWVVCELSC